MRVWRITFGPAKPMRALGSASTRSPRAAKLAMAPPMVGFVRIEMKRPPAWSSRLRAALVFAICMRESMPSSMRAPPPEPDTKMKGHSASRASSMARQIFSPTTEPMLPRRKRESLTPNSTGWPPTRAVPTTQASARPVFFCTSSRRSW